LLVEQHAQDALAVSHWAYVLASGQVRLAGPAAAVRQRDDLGEIFLGRTVDRPGEATSGSCPERAG
jgi:ABC-type branched-subunit amino acid transport system ATPase component